MVRIVTPNQVDIATKPQELATNVPTQGAQMLSNTVQQAGQQLAAVSKQFLEESYTSIQDTYTTSAATKAQLEFSTRVNERMAQKTDKNGNPTFATLEKDIDAIGQEVKGKYGQFLDPKWAQKYSSSYDNMFVDTKIKANSEARRQQLAYVQEATENSINDVMTMMEAGSITPEAARAQLNVISTNGIKNGSLDAGSSRRIRGSLETKIQAYESKVRLNGINDAIEADPVGYGKSVLSKSADELGVTHAQKKEMDGRIRAEQARVEKQRQEAAVEDLLKNHKTDPKSTEAYLAATPESLGISYTEKAKRDELAKSLLQDDIKKEEAQAKEAEEKTNNAYKINENQLRIDLLDENKATGLADIEAAHAAGNIRPETYITLKKEALAQEEKKAAKQETRLAISNTMKSGESLQVEFTPKQINDHFTESVKVAEGQQPKSLPEKAQIAATYTAPIAAIQKEIKYGLTEGTEEQAAQALQSYKYLSEKNPISLEGMKPKDVAFATLALDYVEYGIPVKEAIQKARDVQLEISPVVVKEAEAEFNSLEEMKPKNIDQTLKEGLELDGYFSDTPIDPAIKSKFKNTLRTLYSNNGRNLSAAMKGLNNLVKNNYGTSVINSNGGEFMFLPPEKIVPGIPIQVLKEDLYKEFIPSLPVGVDPRSLMVRSDTMSTAVVDPRTKKNIISYEVYYMDQYGFPKTIPGADGSAKRWVLNYGELIQMKNDAENREALQIREEAANDPLNKVKAKLPTGVTSSWLE